MVIERLDRFPYDGSIYYTGIDENLPPDEQVETDIVVLDTKCDIQEVNRSNSGGFINATFAIFFPFDKSKPFEVKRGMFFKGTMYGMEVRGEIIGVFPTQLSNCTIYIKDGIV